METLTLQKTWTDEELMSLEHPGNKCELVDGELIMIPVGPEHEEVGATFIENIRAYVRKHNLGFVWGSSVGYRMNEGNVRSPDVSFVSKEKLKGYKRPPKTFPNFAPDLAVEILSPSDTIESQHQKIVEYFQNGTKLVWVVSPEEQVVFVYHSPRPDKILQIG
ncbi:MAG: Uma2 family endonuclease, partial [Bacteroidetes bacterium]